MYFPFRCKEFKETKKGSGYMVYFENQYGQRLGYYVSNDRIEEYRSIYSVGSVYRLDVYARSGTNGMELALDVPGLMPDEPLF